MAALICFTRKGSIDLKGIIIHMLCSVRYFPFHSKQGAAIFQSNCFNRSHPEALANFRIGTATIALEKGRYNGSALNDRKCFIETMLLKMKYMYY